MSPKKHEGYQTETPQLPPPAACSPQPGSMCLLPNILAGTGRRCQILEEVFENTKILLGRGDTHVESNSLLSGEGLTSLWTQQKNRREWESPPPPPPDTFAETGSRQEPVSQAAPAKLCPYWAERFLPDPSSAWRAGHPAPPPPPASIPKSSREVRRHGAQALALPGLRP